MEIDDDAPGSGLARVWGFVVPVLAILLFALGFWALGGAIVSAWGLFHSPEDIAYFARYFLDATDLAKLLPSGAEGVAHYVAWVAVVVLLLVLGKLGAWALGAAAALIGAGRRR